MVKIHNFSESFPHHVDLVWLHVAGLAPHMTRTGAFHDFVHGYEPRATFPHQTTIDHIAESIQALQADEPSSASADSPRNSRDLRAWVCSLTCGLTPSRTQPMPV